MPTRTAACSCGQLRIACTGDPIRISICHCLDCQKRTGSVFAAQARFPAAHCTIAGHASEWTRTGDAGSTATFRFCPTCGSTVYWTNSDDPQNIAVATGAFADPSFPPPQVSVYEDRMHPWSLHAGDLPLNHIH